MILLSLLAFVLIFSFLIIIHEFGHFYAARKSGVKVHEFAVGFGKKIIGKKFGETEFNWNLVPFGGFVRMEGEDSESDDPRSFSRAPLINRMIITLGGVFMNFIFAILALTILFSVGTNPILVSKADVLRAEEAGVVALSEPDENGMRRIEYLSQIQKNPAEAFVFSLTETVRISQSIIEKVAEIPGEIINNQRLPDGLAGPVGIAEVTHKVLPQGLMALLKLAALLSISLAVMNLLPIPALDGGRFFFQLIELVLIPFKVKPSETMENYAHFGGYVLLMGFLVAVTWNDIVRVFEL